MKVIRTSDYRSPSPRDVLHIFVSEHDIRVSPEEYAAHMLEGPPGAFVAAFIYDLPEGMSEVEMSLEIRRRWMAGEAEQELHQAMLYHWMLMQLVQHPKAETVVQTTIPAPLSQAEVTNALSQLARHPAYLGQSIRVASRDGQWFELTAHGVLRRGGVGPMVPRGAGGGVNGTWTVS